jgi:hypothetical protein
VVGVGYAGGVFAFRLGEVVEEDLKAVLEGRAGHRERVTPTTGWGWLLGKMKKGRLRMATLFQQDIRLSPDNLQTKISETEPSGCLFLVNLFV